MNKQIVVIRCKGLLRSEEMNSLEEKLRKEYETGFMFVPCYCEVFIADEVDARENLRIEKRPRFGGKPQGEWIPVSERLPEQGNTCYLATVDYGDSTFSCQRFFYNAEIGWDDDSVIAWQPLPEPYKKEGAE